MNMRILDLGLLWGLYLFYFYRRWQNKGKDYWLSHSLMYWYICIVLYLTLMPIAASLPFIFSHAYTAMNMIPFIDVIKERGDFIRQIVFNISMTVPFGFLLPMLDRKYERLWKVVGCTFLLSLAIEMTQPLLNPARSADITDLITNTFGGLLGYAFYWLCRPLVRRLMTVWHNER